MSDPRNNSEIKLIQDHLSHSQSTHKSVVSASVGMAIYKLNQIYGKPTDAEMDAEYLQVKNAIFAHTPDDKKEACEYLLNMLAGMPTDNPDAFGQFEILTVFIDGEKKEINAPLKHVITLVWKALTDDKKYSAYIENIGKENTRPREEAINQDHNLRLLSFYNCLENIHKNRVCRTGNRHELVFLLQGYPPDFIVF